MGLILPFSFRTVEDACPYFIPVGKGSAHRLLRSCDDPFSAQRLCHIGKHIFNEDPIPRCRIADEHVCYRADELAVLNDRRDAHESGQYRTTIFRILYDIGR